MLHIVTASDGCLVAVSTCVLGCSENSDGHHWTLGRCVDVCAVLLRAFKRTAMGAWLLCGHVCCVAQNLAEELNAERQEMSRWKEELQQKDEQMQQRERALENRQARVSEREEKVESDLKQVAEKEARLLQLQEQLKSEQSG